jgi:hypothetical protein
MRVEYSYNDWPASPDPAAIGIDAAFTECGIRFPGGVKSGDVATVFRDLVWHFNTEVEQLTDGWCWGYDYRANVNDPSSLSCHASGTALDLNAPLHANGAAETFTADQVAAIRRILGMYGGAIAWGGDFYGTVDEMHFEVAGGPEDIHALALETSGHVHNEGEGEAMALSDDDVQRITYAVLDGMTSLVVSGNVYNDGIEQRINEQLLDALATLKTSTARTQKAVGAGS